MQQGASTPRWMQRWPWWPAVLALSFALIAPLSPHLLALEQGGLAPLAVAAVVALFVGAPLAQAEGHLGDPRDPLDGALAAVAHLVSALLIATLATSLLPDGVLGGGSVVALWGTVALVGTRFGPLLAVLCLAATGLLLASPVSLLGEPAWTLLSPSWEQAPSWLSGAIVAGFLLPAAGVGQWSRGPRVQPGRRHLPWLVTGAALFGALAISTRTALRFEALAVGEDPVWLAAAGLGVVAAASTLTAPTGWATSLLGLGLTLWLWGPAAASIPLVWSTLLPLAIFVTALRVAMVRPEDRGIAGLAAGLSLVACVLGWPGWPSGLVDAGLAALTLVLCLWWVGTPYVLRRVRT